MKWQYNYFQPQQLGPSDSPAFCYQEKWVDFVEQQKTWMNILIFIYIWFHWLAGCFNINIMTCVFRRWYWTHWRLQRPTKREGKHCLVTWLEVLGMEWNTSWTCCIWNSYWSWQIVFIWDTHFESGEFVVFGVHSESG